jgi:prolyl-tRNA editing enzyme YbaK/EbsC (Cys-tRNA(Pro) deacylase)
MLVEKTSMSDSSNRIKRWMEDNNVNAEILSFSERVYTVEEAVAVSGYPVERFTKSIVMLTSDERLVIALVPADARASTDRVRKALGLIDRPRIVTSEESERYLGQQLGGNSPLNAPNATILIDPKVLERDWILTGGGDDRNLVKIPVAELKRVVTYTEARVRK